uniref:Uncharacterized protein n=1 Tax=Hucho hucho TaxID=62062 RepID=A0A4W5K8V7_9TELE
MAHIISHDLSKTMNWKGINGKVPFCQLQLKERVNSVVWRNRVTSNATDKVGKKAICVFLKDGPLFVLPTCTKFPEDVQEDERCFRWMDDHKFIQHSETLMNLLNIMGGEFTTDSVDIPFPEDLYKQAEYLPTDDTVWFILQTLDKIAELFDGELDSVWDEKKVEIFLNVLTSQSDGLQSCVTAQKKKNNNLQMYFKRLNNHVLKRMAYSAHAWELVRKEVRTHLLRLVLLGSATENSI